MSYKADSVTIRQDTTVGGWYASILLIGIQCDVIEGWGDTRQEAIANLQKEIRRLHDKWQAASHAMKEFLLEEET